jgi:TonB family protein
VRFLLSLFSLFCVLAYTVLLSTPESQAEVKFPSPARHEPVFTVLGVHDSELLANSDAEKQPVFSESTGIVPDCNISREKEEADVESAYRAESKLKLAKIWDLSKSWTSEPVLYVVINRDGHLKSSAVVHSSGDTAVDEAAMKMVQSALPLASFPFEIKRDSVDFLVSPSIAKVLLNPPSKLERKRAEMAYNHQSHAWIKEITNHFNAKFKEQKFKKVELVRVYIVIYEETGEIILKKVDQSSCNPAFDQKILDLIQPPIPKSSAISPSRVLRMYLDFKSWI